MLKKLLVAASLLAIAPAFSQTVQQSGTVTAKHVAAWVTSGVIGDGGSSASSPITSLGVTNNGGSGICVNSALPTSPGYQALCLGANTTGPATISLQNFGTATAQNLQFVINGTVVTLPTSGQAFVLANPPFTAGHASCFLSTVSTLIDCGVSVVPGTQFGLPYYSTTSTQGSTGAGSAGQFLLGQGASVPLWTSLSGDVTSVSALGALTLGKVNGIPFNTSYTAHGVLFGEGSGAFVSSVTSNVGNCLLSQGTSSDPIWASCASGSGSAGGSNTQVQFNNSTALGGSPNLTWVSPALTIGVAGTTTGQLQLAPAGSAIGTVTIQNPSSSAAYNFNLPAAAGTAGQPMLSGGGGGTPMTFGTLGTAAGGTNCSVASGTCLDNITAFSSTGFIQRTGAGTYAFSTVVPVSGGGTGIANGNSGGILGFTGSGTIASSAALAQFGVVVGGGAGNTPTAITPGTAAQLLLAQTSANPSWNTLSGDATIGATGALTIANGAVTVAKQANAAGFSLEGNFTGSSAAPQFSTIAALTNKASPAAGDLLLISDSAAAGAIKQATISSIASAGSVASIAGNTGAFTLAGGVTNTTNQIQIAGAYASLNAGFNCSIAASVSTNILTVAMKDAGGNDPTATSPCYLNYRDPTAATGATTLISQTAALNITTNATGATLGAPANVGFRIWVVVFNNSGTNVLALYNAVAASASNPACTPINEGTVQSSTAISGSATSAGVYYSPNGITVTSKPVRILGYVEYNSTGLVTPGTYATAPNFIQVFGPGIFRPCQPTGNLIQTNTTTNDTGTTSTTYAASAFTSSITPSSAANFVKADFKGTIGASGINAVDCKIQRGTTWITASGATLSVNASAQAPVSSHGFDFPNATTSQTYTVFRRSNNVATTAQCPFINSSTEPAAIILEEFMG